MLETCRDLERRGYEVTYLQPDRTGHISADDLAAALRPDTALVSMMLVNNELGTLLPVADCVRAVRAYSPDILFHCDAVQGFLKVPFPVAGLGTDLVTVSGHKIGAPKGIGALYVRKGVRLAPLLTGGGQEEGLRSGTEPTAQIAGFAKAVELYCTDLDKKRAHMADIKAYALQKLLAIDGVVRIGNGGAPHILAVSLVGYPSSNVVNELSSEGIAISAGSACHRGALSHGYTALGLDKKTAAGVLRISFGPETTRAEIDALAQALARHRAARFPLL